MNQKPRKNPQKPDRVIMPISCTKAFRDAVQERVKAEGRGISTVVRWLLKGRYKDLPDE